MAIVTMLRSKRSDSYYFNDIIFGNFGFRVLIIIVVEPPGNWAKPTTNILVIQYPKNPAGATPFTHRNKNDLPTHILNFLATDDILLLIVIPFN